MRILIITDAWKPQINGVVRTLEATTTELKRMGHEVEVIGPDATRKLTVAMPFYSEIKLELFAHRRIKKTIRNFAPDFIHIATEGPLGWAARGVCMRQTRPFTTSYHTRFPEYLAARAPRGFSKLTLAIAYAALRRFHAPAGAIMVATASMERELVVHKFPRQSLMRWSRGVDMDLFALSGKNFTAYESLPRPILLYVGRVAVEKNLPAFLNLKTKGSLVVVGDGPDFIALNQKYPHAHFLGAMQGATLARAYAAADLFVFPSTTDTFGLVLLEACAAGLRIAAYPAPGPSDIFAPSQARKFSALNTDLQQAVDTAVSLPDTPDIPRAFASSFSWSACAAQFYTHLQAPSPTAKKRLSRWRRKIGVGM